ncbi:PAS domain S-box protein, partial [Candidatus Bathyarchaeota archaeon]
MTESIIESSAEVALDVISKAPIQVLHVDDDSGFLKAAKQILEMQGNFQVETASSVEEAKERMKQKPYDVIVSDYIMLGKDGLEFLKELRDSGNNTPFIMFTGKGREEVAIEALNLGADRYFNKIGSPEAVYGELAHGICQTVERRRAAEEVWKKEQRLRAVLTSSPDIITVSDLQGNITDCNDAAWKLMGFSSKEELIGKSAFEFIAEEDRERALENLKKTFEEGTIRNVEYTLLKKNGEEYIGELSASILKDSSGNQIGFVSVVRNITERKKTKDKISRQNEFLNSVLESLTHPFYVIDANDYTIKMANSAAHLGSLSEKTTCYGITHKRKKPCSSVKHPCPLEIVKKTKRPAIVEHIHYDKDENVRIIEVHAYPIFDKDRNVAQIIEYGFDITERKKIEGKLQDANKKWVSLTENTDDLIMIVDGKGIIQYVNRTIPPYTLKETIG